MTEDVGCKGGLKDGQAQKQVGREEMSRHGDPMLRAQNQAPDRGSDPLLLQAGPGERGRLAKEGLGQRPSHPWAPALYSHFKWFLTLRIWNLGG